MSEMQILNEENAVRFVLKELKANLNFKWEHIHYINKKRYAIVKGDSKIAILFKKEPFNKFGEMFEGESGQGDTVNCKHLQEFIVREVKDIYIIRPNGQLFKKDLYEFIKLSHKWTNKEGKEVRSISIHKLEEVNIDQLQSRIETKSL